MKNNRWKKVVFAADLKDCVFCEEKWCSKHKKHYSDCDCIGATQEGVEYKKINGVLYGRLLQVKG